MDEVTLWPAGPAATGTVTLFAPRPKCSVSPVKLRGYVPELACMVQRTIGYRAACTCGVRMPVRNHPSEARVDKREHEATHSDAAA